MTRARRAACATFVLAAVWTMTTVPLVHAASAGFATLEAAAGEVVVLRQGQAVALAPSLPLQLEDVVLTKRGRATVRFLSDGTVLRVGPDTRVQVNESATERGISVFFGRVWAHVVRWRERPTRFESGSTIAAIRGTEIAFAVDGEQTQVAVLEGQVHTQTDAGQLELSGGQVAVGQQGQGADARRRRSSRSTPCAGRSTTCRSCSWARPSWAAARAGRRRPRSRRRRRARATWRGRSQRSTASPRTTSARRASSRTAPRCCSPRAAWTTRRRTSTRALKLSATDADALSLRAIVAVVDNQPDAGARGGAPGRRRGLALGHRARRPVLRAPGALRPRRRAREPGDRGEAGARRRAGVGAPRRGALGARPARRGARGGAEGEQPRPGPGAHAVGARLRRTSREVKTAEARAAFEKAAKLDPSDPLARLGLGLAKIRDGALAEGSRDLEVAVSLDPGQSLAAQLPRQGVLRAEARAAGRPRVRPRPQDGPEGPDALAVRRDLQADDQPAGRGAGEPAGGDRAQRQPRGVPLAPAARLRPRRAQRQPRPRLLRPRLPGAGARRGLAARSTPTRATSRPTGCSPTPTPCCPRHEIARVSELFQSQMLQPLNTTPIQPSLGESNLLLISSQGPGARRSTSSTRCSTATR